MSFRYQQFNQNKHEAIWIGGISLAHSETAKHKCRALPKIKGWLNIVIHSNEDPVIVILNINQKQSIKMIEVLSNWCLYKKRMTDTSILHHDFMLILIALWAVILLCGTIFMPFLSYFARFIWRGRIRQLEFWTGKGASLSPLFCATPIAVKINVDFFGNI